MNYRHNIIILSAATALGLALLSGSAISQQKSLKDQLVGTWSLVSWEQTLPNGSKLQRFGANPKGIFGFDASGRFYLIYARPNLPKIANPLSATPDEAKAIVNGSLALFGTYTVDEAKKAWTVRYEVSTFPNQVGTDANVTPVSITDNEMTFRLPEAQILVSLKRTK